MDDIITIQTKHLPANVKNIPKKGIKYINVDMTEYNLFYYSV